MNRQLNITGKNSSEIYTLLYPNNLINFCKYDFTLFLNHCTDLCRLANRTGEYSVEDVYSIRNSISGCHKYYEQNMRTKFEKIVIDCWIEYLCRQNEVSTGGLWQSFMRCRNEFEKAVFSRLSEYRHNRAINEWVNLLKLQEYAQRKVDFVFGTNITSAAEAGCRANYFDLMFNIAANEQGFPVDEIGSSNIYSIGRVPNSPFILTNASREIMRNVLNNMDYSDRVYKSKPNPNLSDRTAMDAFSVIKNYIPDKNDSLVNTIIKSLSGSPQKVYIPTSFKAVIDLEIDATIESGGFIRKCPRCGEFYLKDSEYPYDYCNRMQKDGSICIEVMNNGMETPPALPNDSEPAFTIIEPKNEPLDKAYVNEKLEALYKEMAQRVNVDMTQRDFSMWYQAELRLKEQLLIGAAGEEDLEKFIELSRSDEFASKKKTPAPLPPPKEEDVVEFTESGKEVKKFVFERVERPVQQPKQSLAESEKATLEAMRRLFAAAKEQPPQQSAQPQQFTQPQQAPPFNGQAAQQQFIQQSQQAQPFNRQAAQPQQFVQQPQQAQPFNRQAAQPQQFAQQPQYNQQQPYYAQSQQQQFIPPKATTKIIRGGAANSNYTESPFDKMKSKAVVIPNGEAEKHVVPFESKQLTPDPLQVRYPAPEPEADDSDVKVFRTKHEIEEDVKVFIPKSNNFAEFTPYEKLKQPLEEYKQSKEQEPDPELEGQLTLDEIKMNEEQTGFITEEPQPETDDKQAPPPAPIPQAAPAVSAKALSAYKNVSGTKTESETPEKPEKANFAGILEGMARSDGFKNEEEEELDADGMPISHKTKHVMNALFGNAKASPILRVNIFDDEE